MVMGKLPCVNLKERVISHVKLLELLGVLHSRVIYSWTSHLLLCEVYKIKSFRSDNAFFSISVDL
jgi:hypothetical protein